MGTASVRAALVTREGQLKSTAEEPISIWEPQSDHYVQSSTEIWQKCCTVVKVKRELRGLSQLHFNTPIMFNRISVFRKLLRVWRGARCEGLALMPPALWWFWTKAFSLFQSIRMVSERFSVAFMALFLTHHSHSFAMRSLQKTKNTPKIYIFLLFQIFK